MKAHRLIALCLLFTISAVVAQHEQARIPEEDDAVVSVWTRASLDIRRLGDNVAGCLPNGESDITVQKAAVASMDAEWPPGEWAIELIPSAKPITLRAGGCITFGITPKGYEQIGGMHPLKVGHTYGFALLRGNTFKDRRDRRYLGIFCIQRHSDGRLAYLPYIDHPDGSITYPPCGSYMGGPPAADGIAPPGSPSP